MISSRPDAAEREADRWAGRPHSRIGRDAQQWPVRVAGNRPAGQRRSLLHLGFASQWRRCAPVVQRAFLLARRRVIRLAHWRTDYSALIRLAPVPCLMLSRQAQRHF